MYSLPSITSSASVLRNFRSRGFEASETTILSSSLSHQAACRDCLSLSLSARRPDSPAAVMLAGVVPGPESRKKSLSQGMSIVRGLLGLKTYILVRKIGQILVVLPISAIFFSTWPDCQTFLLSARLRLQRLQKPFVITEDKFLESLLGLILRSLGGIAFIDFGSRLHPEAHFSMFSI